MKKKFDSLFKHDSDWHNNACLNFTNDPTIGYVEGYKLAADELVIRINETGRNQDYFIFPIVFLYRHHLELLLKVIIDTGRQLLDEGDGYPKHHKIGELWPLVKGIIRKVWTNGDPEEFDLVEHVIQEMALVDPDSMAFRYPKDKSGNKHVPNLTHVNTRHLGEMIDKVSGFLGGVELGINQYLEFKYEAENYYNR